MEAPTRELSRELGFCERGLCTHCKIGMAGRQTSVSTSILSVLCDASASAAPPGRGAAWVGASVCASTRHSADSSTYNDDLSPSIQACWPTNSQVARRHVRVGVYVQSREHAPLAWSGRSGKQTTGGLCWWLQRRWRAVPERDRGRLRCCCRSQASVRGSPCVAGGKRFGRSIGRTSLSA